jgi:thiol:disulfide interchange protein/DsbC/DsbD-like thiol-disulfide interchange protein
VGTIFFYFSNRAECFFALVCLGRFRERIWLASVIIDNIYLSACALFMTLFSHSTFASLHFRYMRHALCAALAVLAIFLHGFAQAAPVKTPHVEAELIGRHTAIVPGQPIEAALRLKIIDHWHTYWVNPGDSGLPTKLAWTLPAGFTAGAIEWPHPKKLPLGPLTNFGYEGEVLHLVTLQTPVGLKAGENVTLSAKADWLVCADVCIPEEGVVSLILPVSVGPLVADKANASAFTSARAALPQAAAGWKTSATVGSKDLKILITQPIGESFDAKEISFYPLEGDVIANAGKQVLTRVSEGLMLTVPLADAANRELKSLEGVLVADGGWGKANSGKAITISAPLTYVPIANPSTSVPLQAKVPDAPLPVLGLLSAILFALLGGLVLNLMPCVFPVLGIKVMGFVENAHGDASLLRKQGIAFFIGVMLSFMVLVGLMLALRSAGESIGWGFQLQEPLFVAALAVLFFVMALNLSGVFEVGTRLQSAAGNAELNAQKNPTSGAFASGVLATLVATPCMAPGLGASVGFTLNQSVPVALAVFAAMAIGLALPVVLLSFFPALLRRLPKPGAWMETFKQFMAFPLYATVVWLAWVLGAQTGNDGMAKLLIGLTLVAMAAWAYGRWQFKKPMMATVAASIVALLGAGAVWSGASTPPVALAAQADSEWIPFSPQKITELRAAGKGVFVDFTATWCITCQVNKRVALNQASVIKRFGELNIVRMKADWTLKDPVITATLAEFGRNGVPLYVFYPQSGSPIVLPEVLTPSVVLASVEAKNSAQTASR